MTFIESVEADQFDEDGRPTRPSLTSRLLSRDELARLPEPVPLINGTLDKGTVAVLAGYWGTCKSFLAQHWSASVATGTQWQGRNAEAARVLYIAAEGANGLNHRLNAWESAWGHIIDPENMTVLPAPVRLAETGDTAELAHIVRSGGFELLVVDTLARCMPGLDENSSKDMGRIVEALYLLREAMGSAGTVLGVHHTGKDKATVRGSSALEAGVDTVYLTEGDPSSLKLSRTKRKDGPKDDVLALRLSPVEGTKSAVLDSHRGVGIDGVMGDLLSHFRSHFSETGASTGQLRASAGMADSSFYRARNSLVSSGFLVNVGTDARPFYHLSEVAP